jgi:branched-chain amino acid transport system ATP-binding protein
VSLLTVENLDVRHGLLRAVRDINLTVEQGETVAIVGANGAGKSTFLRAIAGAHRPFGGRIVLDGTDNTALPAHVRVRGGLALVPEGRRLFPELTVEENLKVSSASGRKGDWTLEAVLEAFPLLKPLRAKRAATLSGGEQQAAAIGRALMTNPRLLMLDEVSLGLAPIAVESVYRSLAQLKTGRATIILVEQDLRRAMRVAERIVCMLEGRMVLEGQVGELTMDEITEAYFGLKHRTYMSGAEA